MITLPKCNHCGQEWKPAAGEYFGHPYCGACSDERKQIAKKALGIEKPVIEGAYVIPRRLRPRGTGAPS